MAHDILTLMLWSSLAIPAIQPGRTDPLPNGAKRKLGGPGTRYSDCVSEMVFTADGKLLSGTGDGTLTWWDTERGRALRQIRVSESGILCPTLSQRQDLIAVGGRDGSIRLLEVKTGKVMKILSGDRVPVVSLGISADELVAVSNDGTIRLWSLRSGQCKKIETGHAPWCVAAISPSGHALVVGDRKGQLSLWSIPKRERLQTFRHQGKGVNALAFSPDGKVFVSGGFDGRIQMWDILSRQRIGTWDGHKDAVTSILFPTRSMLSFVTGSYDGILHGWSFSQKGPIATLRGGAGHLWALAYSQREAVVAAGYENGAVILWKATAVVPKRSSHPQGEKNQIEQSWQRLQSEDAQEAYENLGKLVRWKNTVQVLRARFQAVRAPDEKAVTLLLTQLGSPNFRLRKKAEDKLAAIRFDIVTILEEELKKNCPLELRSRLKRILEREHLTSQQVQLLRGIQLLEYCASSEALSCLSSIARGSPAGRLGREARDALHRLGVKAK